MHRGFLVVYFLLVLVIGYWCGDEFLQERAKLKYFNPKYIKDVVVFTGRKSRQDPYLTNMTFTTVMPYSNNVTFRVTLILSAGGDFKYATKVCDTFKRKWMKEFMKTFSNLTLDHCPIPPGTYVYRDMELPPKNMPVPIADGDYWIRYELYTTSTKEQILEANTLLRFDYNKKSTNQNKKPKKG